MGISWLTLMLWPPRIFPLNAIIFRWILSQHHIQVERKVQVHRRTIKELSV
jgi:hypothetical protein